MNAPTDVSPSPAVPKPWDSVGLVFVQMLTLLVLSLGLSLVNGFLDFGQNGLMVFTLLGEILLLFPLMVWVRLRRFSWRETFSVRPVAWKMIGLAVGLGVLAWPLATAASLPFEWALSKIGPAPELPVPENLFQIFVLGFTVMVAAPLVEEPMFRGFVLRGWLSVSRWAAIAVSGVLFGMLHGQLAGLVALALVGILLGTVAVRTSSTIPAMVLHGTFNAISFVFLLNDARLGWLDDGDVLIIAAAVLPLFIWLMIAFFRSTRPETPARIVHSAPEWTLVALGGVLVMGLFGVFAALDIVSRLLPPVLRGF